MEVNNVIDNFQLSLSRVADSQRAIAMRAYMKNQFEFLGISAPERRKACAADIQELKTADPAQLLAIAQALWACKEREYHYVAIDILAKHWRSLRPDDSPLLLLLAQQKSWWDTVDGLTGVIGDLLRKNLTGGRQIQISMDAALEHPDFWVRRIALLHQLGWRELTDVDRLFHYALALADEKEFFIRKAIGWALRDYAWHEPAAIHGFLQANQSRFSGLTLREAAKNLKKLGE
ncbi:DNA alkylation repair protein [Undibacterium umbellatum]|jgi:3-methyladenine DNA glycosylase AlkD|uniref:DNA alkylation repair protein n=1 Tax=Undibacterium umbellatum TaxID=2762300 RepID=A0ABR6Z312_9BURK|nr:DNA alkylation repair protein [Undibacterium umbellatum]MBC3906123.1 DNA alkylation repair protein [Undibacterium umbellatum]